MVVSHELFRAKYRACFSAPTPKMLLEILIYEDGVTICPMEEVWKESL
jgi:hypothetical protein